MVPSGFPARRGACANGLAAVRIDASGRLAALHRASDVRADPARAGRRAVSDPGGPGSLAAAGDRRERSEEHTSELQSHLNLVCRLLLEKKKHRITTCMPS